MNTSEIIVQQLDDQIAMVVFNRSLKRNALSIKMMEILVRELERLNQSPKLRAIIFRGEGPVFCAGLDLEEAKDVAKVEISAKLVAKILVLLYHSPITTIAAVHGAALGGGAGLMCACDFAIADAKTVFGFPETLRGLVAALIMPIICRQIQQRDLKELLLTGATINAKAAKEIKLINAISNTPEELVEDSLKKAKKVIQGAPNATTLTKSLLNEINSPHFVKEIEYALQVHEEVRLSSEVQEGIDAYLEHRQPNWI
jgi:methylglutaconyl-CoA hydratase